MWYGSELVWLNVACCPQASRAHAQAQVKHLAETMSSADSTGMIIVDDNMFYRSMRKQIFLVAKRSTKHPPCNRALARCTVPASLSQCCHSHATYSQANPKLQVGVPLCSYLWTHSWKTPMLAMNNGVNAPECIPVPLTGCTVHCRGQTAAAYHGRHTP